MPTSKEPKAIHRIGQKSYHQTQQMNSQSTFAMPDPARSGQRASTSSSQTSLISSNATEDEMEVEVDTQQLAQQAGNTQRASSLIMMAFATGWNYFFKYIIATPTNLTAAGLVIRYWRPDLNVGIWIAVFGTVIIAINFSHLPPTQCLVACANLGPQFLHVSSLGEMEFWMGTAKIIIMTTMIISSPMVALGGGPNHKRSGFQYWNDSDIYCASRSLYGLARDGQARSIFAKTLENGNPTWAVGISSCGVALDFLNATKSAGTVFRYFVSLATFFSVLNWMAILVSHISFRQGLKAQGISIKDLPYAGFGQPWGSNATETSSLDILAGRDDTEPVPAATHPPGTDTLRV
ncbi:hypothetical protein BHE90_014925 [Fusarium euwallaceae]|uniref:Amino acid permease/ SLC12A domain-containing protein n=1 Tax=Fusarium euwallaceae TaxID=1147111 RepID=A0A430L4R9_9HYPO|nr:hypothetical protein BHE90_014925 [Fusarium euwallaceae]